MGNCATTDGNFEEEENNVNYNQDIIENKNDLAIAPKEMLNSSQDDQNTPKTYYVKIDRIKARNLIKNTNIFCTIQFADMPENRTHLLITDGKMWESSFEFTYVATEGTKSLQENEMIIRCYSHNQAKEKDVLQGQTHLSLYKIASGPFHFDTPLYNDRNNINGRLSFNCVMEQVDTWKINIQKVGVKLKNLNNIGSSGTSNVFLYMIKRDENENEMYFKSKEKMVPCSIDSYITGHEQVDQDLTHYHFEWTSEELMSIQNKCTFRTWIMKPIRLQIRVHDVQESDNPLGTYIGECWVNLERAFYLAFVKKVSPFPLSQRLWCRGVDVGICTITFDFVNYANVNQSLTGVQSENGVFTGSNVICNNDIQRPFRKASESMPQNAQEISKLFDQFMELQRNPTGTASGNNIKAQTELLEKILGYLRISHKESIISYIYSSDAMLMATKRLFLKILQYISSSLYSFNYEVKNLCFEVIFRLLRRAELGDLSLLGFDPMLEQKEDKKENLYKESDIEFANDLINVLFDILSGALQQLSNEHLGQRLSVYISRIITLCMFRLPRFCDVMKPLFWNRQAAEALLFGTTPESSPQSTDARLSPPASSTAHDHESIAYLVPHHLSKASPAALVSGKANSETIAEAVTPIPMFTKSGVTPPIDDDGEEGETDIDVKQLPTIEWLRWIYYTIYPRTNSQSFSQLSDTPNDMLVQLIDWRRVESIVYKKHPETQERYNQLPDVATWSSRITNRGNIYYMIVEAWLQKVLSVLLNMHREIQWMEIPGFNEIFFSFVFQLQTVEILSYPEHLTKVMHTFLANPSTVSVFVKILFMKTRQYNIAEVTNVLELIDSLFTVYCHWQDRLERSRHPAISNHIYKLPPNFDSELFINCIGTLLQSPLNQVIIKVLELLYHQWDILPSLCIRELTWQLLSNASLPALFLHWSIHVRQFYSYLLIYRISLNPKRLVPQSNRNRVDVIYLLQQHVHYVEKKNIPSNSLEDYDLPEEFDGIRQECHSFTNEQFHEFIKYLNKIPDRNTGAFCGEFTSKEEINQMLNYMVLLKVVFKVSKKGSSNESLYLYHKPSLLYYPIYIFYYGYDTSYYVRYNETSIRYFVFLAYLRTLRRIANQIKDTNRWRVYQNCLYESLNNCHPEALPKFNLQKDYLSKMITPSTMDEGLQASLVATEQTDRLILGKLQDVPKELYSYIPQALLAYDEIKKKHDRDYSNGSYDYPYLHWQVVFPTNPLSSRD